MNREIKFRLWNPERNVVTGGNELNTIILTTDGLFVESFIKDKMVWLQFIEQVDKNNKEIYEADIIKDEHGRLYEVFFNSTTSSFCYRQIAEPKKPFDGRLGIPTHRCQTYLMNMCEVVGNIYQNPELLLK